MTSNGGPGGPLQGLRVVVSEPWGVLRRGLVGVLQAHLRVVAEVGDVRQLPAIAAERPVDLFVVGDESDADLFGVVRELRDLAPEAPVMLLFDEIGVERLRGVLQAGARAALSKRTDGDDLLVGVGRVVRGDRVVDQAYLPLLFSGEGLATSPQDEDHLLTPREREVLGELAKGGTNRQIADSLYLGESTIKTHLASIYAKLEVEDRHRAVSRALELGLLR